MTKVDNEERARARFRGLFRPEDEGPNETELEIREFDAARADAARTFEEGVRQRLGIEGRVVRVFKRDAAKPPQTKNRKKGWLRREMREVKP